MQPPPNLLLEEEEETETVGEEAEEVLGEKEEVHPKAKASSSQANNNLSHPQTYYLQVVNIKVINDQTSNSTSHKMLLLRTLPKER